MDMFYIKREEYNQRFAYYKKIDKNGRSFRGEKIEFGFYAKNVGDQTSYKSLVAGGIIRGNSIDNAIEFIGYYPSIVEDDYVRNLNTGEVFRIDRVNCKDYNTSQYKNGNRPIKIYTLLLSR